MCGLECGLECGWNADRVQTAYADQCGRKVRTKVYGFGADFDIQSMYCVLKITKVAVGGA